jgi:chromate transporter
VEKITKIEWPSLGQSTSIWCKIGLLSFGGPTAQIALMHRLIVAERRWLNESQFLNALSFCMLLPGPEAMQLAIYAGWRIHGVLGGLIAGLLFVLPGAIIMLILGLIYVTFGTVGLVGAAFLGLKAAIVVIVLQALIRLAKKSLQTIGQWVVAAFGFFGIFVFALPFPLIIGLAALYGFAKTSNKTETTGPPIPSALPKAHDTIKTILVWICLWWAPLLAIDFIAEMTLLAEIGYFFSKLAVVTFGGAYAVLAYMAQDVVGQLNWLTLGEMMDGLGLAETTPGPLILVTEFVGFLAAFKTAGLVYGIAGAGVALWATFVPCFLWIFAGATYLDWLTNQPRLSGALGSIMAAVVGVIANLFIWFALHLFFDETMAFDWGGAKILLPNIATLDLRVTAIAIICSWLAFWHKVGLLWLLGIAGLTSILSSTIGIG